MVEDVLSLNGINRTVLAKGTTLSHLKSRGPRVIEKRRRDRINTSLGELSHLLPAAQSSLSNGKQQGSGKLEKAEVLELTVDYLKALQGRLAGKQDKDIKTEGEKAKAGVTAKDNVDTEIKPVNHFGGYKDCTEEVFRFLVNVEAMDMQQPCFQRLMAHLRHQIQLLAESKSEVLKFKGRINTESGKRTASKRSFQGTMSSSSSTSSSTGERSGSGGKAKRARLHAHHSSNSKGRAAAVMATAHPSAVTTVQTMPEKTKVIQQYVWMMILQRLRERQGNSRKESENNVTNNGSGSVSSGSSTSRNGNKTSSSPPSCPSMLPQGGNIPLRAPFLSPPCAIPTYALHPAGTHYIPIILHPSVPVPPALPAFMGSSAGQFPFGMIPPAGGGGFGMPPQLPFGLPFPYAPPVIPPYASHAPPMGFPFFNGLRKDLPRQGATDPGNVDSGSNGDDCSIESCISPEGIVIQTDTHSPSNSGNESSNTDEGGC
ncbi:hypothetical protein OS493_018837 [Desmophyllum pertusum]|uniref:BHLH domain-containing protein n=1 Tax=Desmophyllum pertusum TaxID=174260 RepID=A0A9W9ZCH4_9CNID|nr:hypothetical protein OS493_018837 [Desmophyllum pertusum]